MPSRMAAPISLALIQPRRRTRMRTPSPKAPQTNLLCKLAFFIALLPLLPSQAPHSVGRTISAGIWELLRLLIVGIAISYGLFSRRNVDSDFGNDTQPPKADAVRSFASHVLRVPPVFDAEDEVDGGKLLAAWRSKSIDEISNIRSKESAALPSPIPWRSRSGKTEEIKAKPARSHSLPAAFDAGKLLRKTPSFLPLRQLSPSPSLPPEMPAKTNCSYNCSCNRNSTPQSPPTLPATMVGATKMPKRLMDDAVAVDDPNSNCTRGEEQVVEESAREVLEDDEIGGEGEEENEVDKKADEFIAKFREEIRRQRIESIKRSAKKRSSTEKIL